jgi:hypothetical protein
MLARDGSTGRLGPPIATPTRRPTEGGWAPPLRPGRGLARIGCAGRVGPCVPSWPIAEPLFPFSFRRALGTQNLRCQDHHSLRWVRIIIQRLHSGGYPITTMIFASIRVAHTSMTLSALLTLHVLCSTHRRRTPIGGLDSEIIVTHGTVFHTYSYTLYRDNYWRWLT